MSERPKFEVTTERGEIQRLLAMYQSHYDWAVEHSGREGPRRSEAQEWLRVRSHACKILHALDGKTCTFADLDRLDRALPHDEDHEDREVYRGAITCSLCRQVARAVVKVPDGNYGMDLCYSCMTEAFQAFDGTCGHTECEEHKSTMGRECLRRTEELRRSALAADTGLHSR